MNLAIIPARSGSTRIKDKNIMDFCGTPMIGHPICAARESGLFDTIHVSTDSDRYVEIVQELGEEVEFLRDPALCQDRVGAINVLRWVVREFKKRGRQFDNIWLIMATAPLLKPEDLKRGLALFEEHGRRHPVAPVAAFASPVERGFRIGDDGLLEAMFPEKQIMHSQDFSPVYHEAGTFFLISREQLMADEADTYNAFLPLIVPRYRAVDIDEPEDLVMAEILFRGQATVQREGSDG
jgi:N-acylneuraminate cytidylyltransferase